MDSAASEFPFLANLGLMLTYRCSIACPHCIVEAGPHRREQMPLADALDWIEQARAFRSGHITGLALTGGEPFYDLELLRAVSAHAESQGFFVSVVTNAFWAATPDEARATLESLPALRVLSISTDAYHQRAIPIGHVENALAAARALGRHYNIAVCTDREDSPEFRSTLARLEELGETPRTRVSITFPVGRAVKRHGLLNHRLVDAPAHCACSMASSPVVFPNGDVIGCIGPVFTLPPDHPLFLGNLRREPLSAILDRAESNLAMHALRVWGPHRLVRLLREADPDLPLPSQYIENCVCDVCYKLFSESRILDSLRTLLSDPALQETIAYARVYYLGEETLARLLRSTGALSPVS